MHSFLGFYAVFFKFDAVILLGFHVVFSLQESIEEISPVENLMANFRSCQNSLDLARLAVGGHS